MTPADFSAAIPQTLKHPYLLGGQAYPTKAAVVRKVRQLFTLPTGEMLSAKDEAFVRDLLALHPRAAQKSAGVVVGFSVELNGFNWPSLAIVKTDGRRVVFSYQKCLGTKSARQCLKAALRYEVADQIASARKMFFSAAAARGRDPVCMVTGAVLREDTCHVHHARVEFDTIAEDFISAEEIDPALGGGRRPPYAERPCARRTLQPIPPR
jgi:hypothetical protein